MRESVNAATEGIGRFELRLRRTLCEILRTFAHSLHVLLMQCCFGGDGDGDGEAEGKTEREEERG